MTRAQRRRHFIVWMFVGPLALAGVVVGVIVRAPGDGLDTDRTRVPREAQTTPGSAGPMAADASSARGER